MAMVIHNPEKNSQLEVFSPSNTNYMDLVIHDALHHSKLNKTLNSHKVDNSYEQDICRYESNNNHEPNNIESLNLDLQHYKLEQQVVIYKQQMQMYQKLIASNPVMQRRLQLAMGFVKLDALKRQKPKGLIKRLWDKIRNKKATVKTIKESGYNMSEATLRNDLQMLCNLGILDKISIINDNGRRVNDYKLKI